MFFTFLNKDEVNYLDLPLIRKYPPDRVLLYFYNSTITIPVETYTELLSIVESGRAGQYLLRWYRLFEEIGLLEDADFFIANEYLDVIGPYYYPTTNSRVYFVKEMPNEEKYFTINDYESLNSFQALPNINKELQGYYKNRRNAKKSAKNKDELIKDIDMCLKSFREIKLINQHINFINKLLESRYNIVSQIDLMPIMPDNIPIKPHNIKGSTIAKENVIPFTKIKLKRKAEIAPPSFNYDTKVYLIKYREYEKACDRYKEILNNWHNICPEFLEKCYLDIEEAEQKLKKATETLETYNHIINKSYVHENYQDVFALEKFKHYMETGRAENLQDCMNILEDEKYWQDIKDSQLRIENTIYFLQSETDLTRFADENINKYLKQFHELAATTDNISD